MTLKKKRIWKISIIITLVLTSSLFITVHQFLLFRIGENLVALLVYSFVRVATSGFRIIPHSLVVVVVFAQMRSESGITPYSPQHGIVRVVLVTSPDY